MASPSVTAVEGRLIFRTQSERTARRMAVHGNVITCLAATVVCMYSECVRGARESVPRASAIRSGSTATPGPGSWSAFAGFINLSTSSNGLLFDAAGGSNESCGLQACQGIVRRRPTIFRQTLRDEGSDEAIAPRMSRGMSISESGRTKGTDRLLRRRVLRNFGPSDAPRRDSRVDHHRPERRCRATDA